jgi:effector-binding domain-containing protein
MKVHELPAALMASTVHHGSYSTLGDAYEAILRWVEANSYRIAGPSREIYLYNQWPVSRDDDSYVTEVQFTVAKVG